MVLLASFWNLDTYSYIQTCIHLYKWIKRIIIRIYMLFSVHLRPVSSCLIADGWPARNSHPSMRDVRSPASIDRTKRLNSKLASSESQPWQWPYQTCPVKVWRKSALFYTQCYQMTILSHYTCRIISILCATVSRSSILCACVPEITIHLFIYFYLYIYFSRICYIYI